MRTSFPRNSSKQNHCYCQKLNTETRKPGVEPGDSIDAQNASLRVLIAFSKHFQTGGITSKRIIFLLPS